jgi:hypothetical protein
VNEGAPPAALGKLDSNLLAAALDRPFQQLAASLAPAAQLASARSYKSDAKPSGAELVTFERLLIDADAPEGERARLLADVD